MSKIILGTVQFGLEYGINNITGKPNHDEVNSIFDYAYSSNVTLLDSAEAYGNAHELIGKYHKNSCNKFEVITKYSKARCDLPNSIVERISYNLEVLNITSIYCYMFHNYDDYINYFDSFKLELLELKGKGIIKKIGVSLHYNHHIEDVLRNNDIDLIQVPYNLFDNLSKREKVFAKAKQNGVEIHTRSVFLQGLFFKDVNTVNGKLDPLKKYLIELKEHVGTGEIHGLALNYVCSNANIDGILLGVDAISQLQNNLSSLNDNRWDSIMGRIDAICVEEESLLNPSNWSK